MPFTATHGRTLTPEYKVWRGVIQRCTNPKCPSWARYGGRGITVCERWREFENFLEDMGERPSGAHMIERTNNDGDYEPSNCEWATRPKQYRNRHDNRMLTHNGETLCLTDWATRGKLSVQALHYRLRKGWSMEDALTTPANHANNNHWRLK
jgi:hypothetical protein